MCVIYYDIKKLIKTTNMTPHKESISPTFLNKCLTNESIRS